MGLIQGVYGAGRRLWNVLGTSRHVMTICTIAGGFGTGYTLGDNRVGMDPETLRLSKLVLLWGANVLSTNPHLWRSILEARRNGALRRRHRPDPDPHRRPQSDWHLAPMPGTDAALALGLLHVVLAEGREDREFIERAHRRLGGLPRAHPRVPALARGRHHRPSGRVHRRAGQAAGRDPAHRHPHRHRHPAPRRRRDGGADDHAASPASPATGAMPGGGACYDTRGFFGLDWAALWRDDLRPRPARALHMTRLGEGLLEVDDPPVKALFVYASNPAASVPHQTKVLRGLAREDLFTVVVEHFLTDTARYADIVLPATMQTEHQDLLIAYGHLYVAWNEPAAAPPGECLPTTEIFRRLARTMGLDTPAALRQRRDDGAAAPGQRASVARPASRSRS